MKEVTNSRLDNKPDTILRKELRQKAIEQRIRSEQETIETWSREICAHLMEFFPQNPGRVVGFFWPMRNEPDLRPLMEMWHEQGVVIALPVVVERNAILAFRAWQPGAAMLPDALGVPTPCGNGAIVPEVLLIPLNAFDNNGFRLGYGAGYFDRTLASIRPMPLSIGVGFEIGRVPTVWPQTHDVPMDWIVTEAGAVRIVQS